MGAGGGPAGSHVLVGRGGSIAKVSDLLELQAQSLERSTSTYAAFVRDAAAQARAANPWVVILAILPAGCGSGGSERRALRPVLAQIVRT